MHQNKYLYIQYLLYEGKMEKMNNGDAQKSYQCAHFPVKIQCGSENMPHGHGLDWTEYIPQKKKRKKTCGLKLHHWEEKIKMGILQVKE